jgi:hypothetical protein
MAAAHDAESPRRRIGAREKYTDARTFAPVTHPICNALKLLNRHCNRLLKLTAANFRCADDRLSNGGMGHPAGGQAASEAEDRLTQ